MSKTFTVGNYSPTESCLCGEPETVEITGDNFRARLCGPCMMVVIGRAEGNGRGTSSTRTKSRGKPTVRAGDNVTVPTSITESPPPTAELWAGDPAKTSK